MTELVAVVHAMTGAMRGARFPADEPIEPVRTLPEELRGDFSRADRVLTGPEARARQTARLFRAAAGIEPASVDPALRDTDPGAWAGSGLADLEPDALEAWVTDPDFAPPGGESASALLTRVGEWLDRTAESAARRVVAVTHPAVVRAIMVRALDMPADRFRRIEARPLSALRLRAAPRGWTVRL